MSVKQCRACGKTKPADQFAVTNRDGVSGKCRACQREYNRAYHRAYMRRRREALGRAHEAESTVTVKMRLAVGTSKALEALARSKGQTVSDFLRAVSIKLAKQYAEQQIAPITPAQE